MKNIWFPLLLIHVLTVLSGQKLYAQSPRIIPTDHPYDAKVSFIRTWDALAPDTVINSLIGRPTKDVRQTTQYFDGLAGLYKPSSRKGR